MALQKEYVNGPIAQCSPMPVFMAVGTALLFFLSSVPVWNAIALLHDPNYTFWCGRDVPVWIIALCSGVIVLYAFSMLVFFASSRKQAQTEQVILMIAGIFITMLGLVLIITSVPLSQQAVDTYNNLLYRCDVSDQTLHLYDYSQFLQGIRQSEDCKHQYSVETCDGFVEDAPYTKFLKTMEDTFRCSGFCYRERLVAEAIASTSLAPARQPVATTLRKIRKKLRRAIAGSQSLLDVGQTQASVQQQKYYPEYPPSRHSVGRGSLDYYPPTLFSDSNYLASCEGLAARDMKHFAGDVAYQMAFQGFFLVVIAVVIGFLKLLGLCFGKMQP